MRFENLQQYRPSIKTDFIYYPHPANNIYLRYNHDVDIVFFRNKYIAAWNANSEGYEGVPGQYNFISYSDDFFNWTSPAYMFSSDKCINPIDEDSQWQPSFLNLNDEVLFCAWCTHGVPKTYVSKSYDGIHWENAEVANAPHELAGRVLGFPTNHGIVTKNGRLLIPCSLAAIYKNENYNPGEPSALKRGHQYRYSVRDTEYAALLISDDKGESWYWSEKIRTASWEMFGESAALRSTPFPTIWEPMVYDEGNGRLGLLIRNSSTQDIGGIMEKSHQMLFYCSSTDDGLSFSQAYPVEVDTICSRNYAVGGEEANGGLFMIHNDNTVRVPKVMSGDRFHLSLYIAPVPDPDLLLPGPVIQPLNGWCCYPNGFIKDNKLFFAASYKALVNGVVNDLPDFKTPFLLPRDSRRFLYYEDGIYNFSTKRCSLGLVLNKDATMSERLTISFKYNVRHYEGDRQIIFTAGGKTKKGFNISVCYNKETGKDTVTLKTTVNTEYILGCIERNKWNEFKIYLENRSLSVVLNNVSSEIKIHILKKFSFGALYENVLWDDLTEKSSKMLLDEKSIFIEYT